MCGEGYMFSAGTLTFEVPERQPGGDMQWAVGKQHGSSGIGCHHAREEGGLPQHTGTSTSFHRLTAPSRPTLGVDWFGAQWEKGSLWVCYAEVGSEFSSLLTSLFPVLAAAHLWPFCILFHCQLQDPSV